MGGTAKAMAVFDKALCNKIKIRYTSAFANHRGSETTMLCNNSEGTASAARNVVAAEEFGS